MHLTFYGAVREVTGSMHLLATDTDRILIDCGMFQGRRKESEVKNRALPFDPRILTNMVLSHAHIDHSGRIPLLTKRNFKGRIYATRATQDAAEYLLLDSAGIQESDANYLNYKTVRNALAQIQKSARAKSISKRRMAEIKKLLKKGPHALNEEIINELMTKHHLESVRPLYTVEDAEQALEFFDGYPYRSPITIGRDMTCKFYDAGHILGSAITIIKARENGRAYTIAYTGDLGRFDKPILRDPVLQFPEEDRDIDLLVMESTYGNRLHDPPQDMKVRLKKILTETLERGGTVMIPAFAYGRTQELIYVLHELYRAGEVPKVPIYVDSPLSTKLTRVFGEHPEVYDRDTHEDFLEKGANPFRFDQIRFVVSVEESIALVKEKKPHIVIASSGMVEAGRILHHLRYKIHQPRNTVLIVGFMAQHTLGRRILEHGRAYEKSGRKGDPPIVKILGKEYPLQAQVTALNGFSAHADKNELLKFVKDSNLKIKQIALVHGEESQSQSFADLLHGEGFTVSLPHPGETLRLH